MQMTKKEKEDFEQMTCDLQCAAATLRHTLFNQRWVRESEGLRYIIQSVIDTMEEVAEKISPEDIDERANTTMSKD